MGTNDLMTERNKRVGAVERTHTEKTSVPIGKRHSAANAIQEGTLTEPVQEEESVKKDRGQRPQQNQKREQADIARPTDPAHPDEHCLTSQQTITAEST